MLPFHLDSVNIPIIVTDRRGRPIYRNQASYEVFHEGERVPDNLISILSKTDLKMLRYDISVMASMIHPMNGFHAAVVSPIRHHVVRNAVIPDFGYIVIWYRTLCRVLTPDCDPVTKNYLTKASLPVNTILSILASEPFGEPLPLRIIKNRKQLMKELSRAFYPFPFHPDAFYEFDPRILTSSLRMASELGMAPHCPNVHFKISAESEYEHCRTNSRDYYINIFAAYLLLLCMAVRYSDRSEPCEMVFRVAAAEKHLDIGFPASDNSVAICHRMYRDAEDLLHELCWSKLEMEPYLTYDPDDCDRKQFHVGATYSCQPARRYGLRAAGKTPLEVEYSLLGCIETLLVEVVTSVRS